jgi:hypothetical protein
MDRRLVFAAGIGVDTDEIVSLDQQPVDIGQ